MNRTFTSSSISFKEVRYLDCSEKKIYFLMTLLSFTLLRLRWRSNTFTARKLHIVISNLKTCSLRPMGTWDLLILGLPKKLKIEAIRSVELQNTWRQRSSSNKATTTQLTGGLLEFCYLKWFLVIRHFMIKILTTFTEGLPWDTTSSQILYRCQLVSWLLDC